MNYSKRYLKQYYKEDNTDLYFGLALMATLIIALAW